MTETSVAGVRSDVKKVIEASVCSRSVVRDAALSWRSAGRAGGGGSNDGNPVAWLQPSAYGGERRHHPVRATCLIGAGRQGQSILQQCEPATSQLDFKFDPLPSELQLFAAGGQIRKDLVSKLLVSGPSFSVIYALSLLLHAGALAVAALVEPQRGEKRQELRDSRCRSRHCARCRLPASATCRRREGRED